MDCNLRRDQVSNSPFETDPRRARDASAVPAVCLDCFGFTGVAVVILIAMDAVTASRAYRRSRLVPILDLRATLAGRGSRRRRPLSGVPRVVWDSRVGLG